MIRVNGFMREALPEPLKPRACVGPDSGFLAMFKGGGCGEPRRLSRAVKALLLKRERRVTVVSAFLNCVALQRPADQPGKLGANTPGEAARKAGLNLPEARGWEGAAA
jgi:hypothetical protein